jgi:arabinose-5-phosphate isomerase
MALIRSGLRGCWLHALTIAAVVTLLSISRPAFSEAPRVQLGSSLREVILEISSKMLGVTAVLDNEDQLKGIITDGDLRRMLEKNIPTDTVTAKDIMSTHPKVIQKDELAINALEKMRQHDITQLLVLEDKRYIGIIHLHDLIREGII